MDRLRGVLDDVKVKLVFWEYKDQTWVARGSYKGLGMEAVAISAVEPDAGDDLWVTVFGYTRPSTLFLVGAEDLCEGSA